LQKFPLTPAPILTWTTLGKFAEIKAPDWWDIALEALFPLDGDGPPSIASYGEGEGQSIEIWAVLPPGKGYVVSMADGVSNLILWLQDQASYVDFMTTRGSAWLSLPKAT
jgi:hypothetical protein